MRIQDDHSHSIRWIEVVFVTSQPYWLQVRSTDIIVQDEAMAWIIYLKSEGSISRENILIFFILPSTSVLAAMARLADE